MSDYVERLFGRDAPRPLPGCSECVRWAARREEFRERRDLSQVTDVNILMRDHQQLAHGIAGALPTIAVEELMRQAAEYEAPEPDPAELAEDKAKLMAYIDQLNAAARRPPGG